MESSLVTDWWPLVQHHAPHPTTQLFRLDRVQAVPYLHGELRHRPAPTKDPETTPRPNTGC